MSEPVVVPAAPSLPTTMPTPSDPLTASPVVNSLAKPLNDSAHDHSGTRTNVTDNVTAAPSSTTHHSKTPSNLAPIVTLTPTTSNTPGSSSMPATHSPLAPGAYPYPEPQAGLIPRPRAEHSNLRKTSWEAATAPGPDPTPISTRTLATYLSSNPTHSVAKAALNVFPPPNPLVRLARRFQVKHSVISGLSHAEETKWTAQGAELRKRAGWKLEGESGDGVVVGELFWKMYLSLLPTIERDPLSGLVSPDLLGSTTTMPLSIISLIPDIIQHYRDVIVRAEKEVFLATNYWQPSNSVQTVSQALRDLSTRVVKEKKEKIVVKIMYDRGSWEQLWNSHAPVMPEGWTPLKLPGADEIPGLDLQVINFHKVLLGTFHAKFLIVDRKVALLNSNNIQDRPNLELMSHFEGPVVDAFYEVALQSWHNALSPALPCLSTPYQPPRDPRTNSVRYLFSDHNPYFDDIEILKAARAARLLLRSQTKEVDDEREDAGAQTRERFRDIVKHAMETQRQNLAHTQEEIALRSANAMREWREFRDKIGLISRPSSRPGSRRTSTTDLKGLGAQYNDAETAAITAANAHIGADDSTIAPTLVDEGSPMKSKTLPPPHAHAHFDEIDGPRANSLTVEAPSTASPISAIVTEKPMPNGGVVGHKEVLLDGEVVDSPSASAVDLPHSIVEKGSGGATGAAVIDGLPSTGGAGVSGLDEGVKSATGEALPATARMPDEIPSGRSTPKLKSAKVSMDEEIPPGMGSKRLFQLSKRFNAAGVLSEAWATVEDSDDLDNFRPHVVHAPHEPFPIAMACRKPHGMPGHQDIRNPQNAAWLAGFRYAKKKVFVQTPTLNARPIVRAVKQACRRGVEVTLFLDLGFNDKGESIPFQGGTNEQVVDRLYAKLIPEDKAKYLKVYWYTGKDQVRPLNAVKKQRNCHIKLAVYDDEVMIIGNGNQDTQSWFHSQEVNVMIDNKQVIAEMLDTLMANQNTMQYGGVGADGVWRDKDGKTLLDHGATGGGSFLGLSGFIAFAKTI